MPVIHIHLMEGRTTEQKQALMREVTRAAVDSLGVKPQSVRILLQELQSGHFSVAGEPKYADSEPAVTGATNGHYPEPVTSN